MRKVIAGILVGALGVIAWNRLHPPVAVIEKVAESEAPAAVGTTDAEESSGTVSAAETRFKCDGRVYCSEMTSCEEAEFFLENCPGVKMDGGNDGVPCERQWCRDR